MPLASTSTPQPSGTRLSAIWRGTGTGLCFAGFWLLAAAAAPIALPAIAIATRDGELRARRTRRLVSLGFGLLLRSIRALGLGDLEVRGEEWLAEAGGRLVVANHPCFLDAVVLLACLPEANCVVKGRLRRNPVFAPYLRLGRYVGNGAGAESVIEDCRAAAQRGDAVLIFPEGTRTRPGAPPHFRRGAAQIALRAGMELLPVAISCDPPVLTHGEPWYRMPGRKVRHVIRFRRPRRADSFAQITDLEPSRAARRLTRGLQDYFIRELALSDDVRTRPSALSPPVEGFAP